MLSDEQMWGNMYIINHFSQFYLGLGTIIICFGANFQPGRTLFYTMGHHVIGKRKYMEKQQPWVIHLWTLNRPSSVCQSKPETSEVKWHEEKFYLLFCFAFFTFLGCKRNAVKSDIIAHIYSVWSTFMQMLAQLKTGQHYVNVHDVLHWPRKKNKVGAYKSTFFCCTAAIFLLGAKPLIFPST